MTAYLHPCLSSSSSNLIGHFTPAGIYCYTVCETAKYGKQAFVTLSCIVMYYTTVHVVIVHMIMLMFTLSFPVRQ